MGRIRKLIGEKCYLSPMTIDDAEIYAHWLNDMEVVRFLSVAAGVINTENERKLLEELSNNHNYSIVTLENDKLIGTCGFINMDNINRNAEIGIFIGDKAYWHQGYGFDAMALLMDYGFRYLNLHNIFLQVYSFNENAINCYRKLGFKEIGRRRQSVYRERIFHDTVFMDILSDDYYQLQNVFKATDDSSVRRRINQIHEKI